VGENAAGMRSFQRGQYFSLRTWLGTALHRIWYLSPEPAAVARILRALHGTSLLYDRLSQRRRQRARLSGACRRLPVPVISVGNLVVGGTGKTPLTMWLADHLQGQGITVAVLSRGYGRSSKGVAQVVVTPDLAGAARQFGDEPTLMATKLSNSPVWVGRQRSQSGKAAIKENGAQLLILDDGYQHWGLDRDLDLVLVDAEMPWGNGHLLPLGPLREPVEHLDRAHAIVITHREGNPENCLELRDQLQQRFPAKPLFACRFHLAPPRWGLDGSSVPREFVNRHPAVVFAGIAKPDPFFQVAWEMGVHSALNLRFADHHYYQPADLARILAPVLAGEAHWLLTTEKDAVRLPASVRDLVATVAVELDFGEDHVRFLDYLNQWWQGMQSPRKR
jgi:tetraacyldisaccharide 4'-kinase